MVAMNVWPTDAADGSVSNEARWRKMGRLWTPTGVAAVAAGSAMVPSLAFPNLTVKAGACWVDGHFCELPGDQVLAVTANGLAVVRFDPAANTAQLLYLDGASAPAQSPTGVYELEIAKITGSALVDWRPIATPTSLTFPTKAALDAWPAPPDGTVAIILDTGRTYQRFPGVPSTWVLIGGPRIGFQALNPGQSWAAGQIFSMSWTQEQFDSDNFGAGGAAVTVPTGLDGMYAISAYVAPTGAVNGITNVQLVIGGGFVGASIIPINGGAVSVAVVSQMLAGQNCQVQIINGHNAAMTFSGQFRMARLSP